jgi:hypothetical protein
MSILNNISNINNELAVLIPGFGAVLLSDDENKEPDVPFEQLLEISAIADTPIDEIFKPIDFPYWSL